MNAVCLQDADRKAAVLASLSTYFGDSALDCIDYAEMNWNSELYTDGGPVSVASTGVATYIATALRKPFNRSVYIEKSSWSFPFRFRRRLDLYPT